STAPHPPGPGLPEHAPSVWISTTSSPSPARMPAATASIQAVGARASEAAVEAQLAQVLERVLGADQRPLDLVQPVVQPGQQEPQRRAAGEQRQRRQLALAERPILAVGPKQLARLGDVEGAVG